MFHKNLKVRVCFFIEQIPKHEKFSIDLLRNQQIEDDFPPLKNTHKAIFLPPSTGSNSHCYVYVEVANSRLFCGW